MSEIWFSPVKGKQNTRFSECGLQEFVVSWNSWGSCRSLLPTGQVSQWSAYPYFDRWEVCYRWTERKMLWVQSNWKF